MQLLSAMIAPGPRETAKAFWREKPVAAHLPYAALIDDRTVRTLDGRLIQVLQIAGAPFETEATDFLNQRKALRSAMLLALATPRFAVYHHVLRRRVEIGHGAAFPDAFSTALDDAWRDRLARKALFANDLYLTLVRQAPPGRSWWGARAAGPQDPAAELAALDASRQAMEAALTAYGVRALSIRETRTGPCSEVLEFLSRVINGVSRPVSLPLGPVADVLATRRVSFGQQTVELSAADGEPRRFAALLSLKDYPAQTFPGMFDELLRLPFEFQLAQSFAFVGRQQSAQRIGLAWRRMRAADDEALSLREQLELAKDDSASGRAAFGEHHLTLAIHGDDPKQVDQAVAEAQAALADLGAIAVREDLGLEPAFWAQLPGNFAYITRRALVSTDNFASLFSGHNFASGQALGGPWGEPISLLETTAAGPYHFNFHDGDLGNFTVIGPSGSGKTVVLNFLLAQARRFSPRLVLFDKDRGAELFVRAIGGRYQVLRPGRASGLNPLSLENTPSNRRFLIDWLGQLVGGEPTAAEQGQISDLVTAVLEAPPELRRLRHAASLLAGHARPEETDLAARLRPWWGQGEHAWLFDNAKDEVGLAEAVVGFDMTRLLDHPVVRTPALMYLFHRVEERLDGAPAMVVVDEGWKALDDPVFTARLKDWLKTLRKRNGIVGFATQSAEDALSSRIAATIVEQSATRLFMANPKARAQDYQDGFGLTEQEFQLVRALPEAGRCFLIKQGGHSAVARLDLSGETELLHILSGREHSVRALDRLIAKVGSDPADWMPLLLAELR